MRNMVFFVILAVLTVIALVGYNVIRTKFPAVLTKNGVPVTGTQPSITPGMGTSLRGTGATGGSNIGPIPSQGTEAGQETTKGGIPLPTISSKPAVMIPSPTTSVNQSTVSYTSGGFSPVSITVKAGTMVTFTNSSNHSMKVGGDSFTQSIAVGNGGLYQYQFNTKGTFGYKDLNNPSYTGTVIVQ